MIVLDNGRCAHPRERRARDPQLHPLRLVPDRVPGLREGRRPRLRLGLRRPHRRGADAAADRTCRPTQGRKLPFLSSLCGACTDACPVGIPLHDMLVRDRALANRAGEASRTERARLGRLVARLVEPAALPRVGPRRRALRPVRPRLRARRELARRPRDAAAAEHEAVPPPLADLDGRHVIDAFIAAVVADGGTGDRVPDSAAARAHVAALLGRDPTLCFWSGDPLVVSHRSRVARPRRRRRPRPAPGSPARRSAWPPTGTLVLTYGDGRSRATGLLPDVHIAVVSAGLHPRDARRGRSRRSTRMGCRAR